MRCLVYHFSFFFLRSTLLRKKRHRLENAYFHLNGVLALEEPSHFQGTLREIEVLVAMLTGNHSTESSETKPHK